MKYLVIGDSGHNEKVAGKCAPDKSLYEWKFNQEIDSKMKKRCADHGIDYYQTNPSPAGKDEIGLSKRAELANTYWKNQGKPTALFISYHANAYGSVFNTARGTETYVAGNASTNSKNAAKYINDEIYAVFKAIDQEAKNRGVKTKNFTVIKYANMPSILAEYGFYTNLDDLKILKNNKDELVEATMKGICKYFGITYKEPKVEVIDEFKNGDYTGKKAKVTANVLNVRFDRGTQYDVIGKLNKGNTVNLNYCLNGWVSIEGYKGNKGLGYVSTDYLQLI